jgi:FkbH-like protein
MLNWATSRGSAAQAFGRRNGQAARIDERHFRTPDDLAATTTALKRVLIIGSCFATGLPLHLDAVAPGCQCDYLLFNYYNELGADPPQPIEAYDFQVIMLPLRTVMTETGYMRLAYGDVAGIEEFFGFAQQQLQQLLHAALRWNREHGILTFVANFAVPQQNAVGRLLPRYDLRNPVHFVERLNMCLGEELQRCNNAFLLDLDQIAGTIGKQRLLDDPFQPLSHGTIVSDWDYQYDQQRIEMPTPLTQQLNLQVNEFFQALWAEMIAMTRTVRQMDMVKLVVVDLDDTLWRGVLAEEGLSSPVPVEGWPLGFIEALLFLKKRGVLLAIISKNDAEQIARLWDPAVARCIVLDDFAASRINWRPKPENMEQLLGELNLLPRSVVYIDDNPVERAAMSAAFPEIRTLGSNPYDLRRVLLWAPETQVAAITEESANRTRMVQAQVEREATRQRLSRDEFLASLAVKVTFFRLSGVDDRRFTRVFELLNKTNQFNTTGRRWTMAECVAAMADSHCFYAFEVEDRFSAYGLVGVIVTDANRIEQFVMSCRVVGLDVELAAVASVGRELRAGGFAQIEASFVETDANLLCRDLYERCGFTRTAKGWTADATSLPDCPPHITLTA